MGDFFHPHTRPKAAKEHRCTACHYPIAQGESHVRQDGVWEHRRFHNRFHDECFEALCDSGETEFMPGSFDPPERLLKKSL